MRPTISRTPIIIAIIAALLLGAGLLAAAYALTRDTRTFGQANLVDPTANETFTKVNNLNLAVRLCDLSTSASGSLEQYLGDSTRTNVTIDPYTVAITGDDQGSHCVFYFTDNATGTRYYADALYADPYIDTLTVSTADRSAIVNTYGN